MQRLKDELAQRELERDAALQLARACEKTSAWACVQQNAGEALALDGSNTESQAMLERVIAHAGWLAGTPPLVKKKLAPDIASVAPPPVVTTPPAAPPAARRPGGHAARHGRRGEARSGADPGSGARRRLRSSRNPRSPWRTRPPRRPTHRAHGDGRAAARSREPPLRHLRTEHADADAGNVDRQGGSGAGRRASGAASDSAGDGEHPSTTTPLAHDDGRRTATRTFSRYAPRRDHAAGHDDDRPEHDTRAVVRRRPDANAGRHTNRAGRCNHRHHDHDDNHHAARCDRDPHRRGHLRRIGRDGDPAGHSRVPPRWDEPRRTRTRNQAVWLERRRHDAEAVALVRNRPGSPAAGARPDDPRGPPRTRRDTWVTCRRVSFAAPVQLRNQG